MEVPEENESVLTVTEPQIWTMIGAVVALIIGMSTVVSTLFVRVLRAEIGGVRSEIGGLRSEMGAEIGDLRSEMGAEIGGLRSEMIARFETVDARFAAVHSRIDTVETRIEDLDRDVRALVKHTFGLDRG